MKPTHPVELLACAIATQEGWFSAGSIPQVRRNPGDLRFAGQLGASRPNGGGKPPFGQAEPIAVFSSNARGITALFRQIWVQVAEGQTVRQIVAQWAPPIENNTSSYLQDVLNWTGLPSDIPVLELLPPLVQLNLPQS
jgi:hypothetical protein